MIKSQYQQKTYTACYAKAARSRDWQKSFVCRATHVKSVVVHVQRRRRREHIQEPELRTNVPKPSRIHEWFDPKRGRRQMSRIPTVPFWCRRSQWRVFWRAHVGSEPGARGGTSATWCVVTFSTFLFIVFIILCGGSSSKKRCFVLSLEIYEAFVIKKKCSATMQSCWGKSRFLLLKVLFGPRKLLAQFPPLSRVRHSFPNDRWTREPSSRVWRNLRNIIYEAAHSRPWAKFFLDTDRPRPGNDRDPVKYFTRFHRFKVCAEDKLG